MDRTNYCADCEQHAREAATLRAQLAAKDEEIEEYKGLLSSEECDTTFWKERCEAKDKTFDEMTDRFVEEKDAAEARVRNCHELIAEATCRISPEDHAELTEQFQTELSGCDCLTVFDEQVDRIAALEAEIAGLRETIEAKDAELAEAKKDSARLAKAADDVLLKFSAPMLPDGDHAVYVCQATVNVRTMEKLKAAIDDTRKAD